jgi:hypothetical protein
MLNDVGVKGTLAVDRVTGDRLCHSAPRAKDPAVYPMPLNAPEPCFSSGSALTPYRNGLRISSAPAESGMSHVVNQRMGKRQPMCWTAEGAHTCCFRYAAQYSTADWTPYSASGIRDFASHRRRWNCPVCDSAPQP